MPLTNSASIFLTPGKKTVQTWATTVSTTISGVLSQLVTSTTLSGKGFLLQEDPKIYSEGVAYDFDPTLKTSGYLTTFYSQLIKNLDINQALDKIVTITPLAQANGRYLNPETNPVKRIIELNTFDVHPTSRKNIELRQFPLGLKQIADVQLVHPNLGSLITLTQDDETGPSLLNIIPASGSTYNSPSSPISFHIVDEQGSAVVSGSINLYVQGIQVISGGISSAPPMFGTAFVQKITDSDYFFSFNPVNPFSPDIPIVVSGNAIDDHIPFNSSDFLYSYRVWNTADLGASLIGLADGQSPYLTNQNPLPGQLEFPVYSDIKFDIVDDHTGLDYDSVLISVNGDLLISGSNNMNPTFATLSLITLSGGLGRRYIINPLSDLSFSETVTVSVTAKDKYVASPNFLNTSYSFMTQTNSQLVASGLKIEELAGFEDLITQHSYPTVNSGTNFKITYTNLVGLGISTSGSYVSANGGLVTSNFVPVSGIDSYDVFFTLTPDYTQDCHLKFHVEQETLSSGITVARDFNSTLLWGAEFCYQPEEKFSYDTEIPVVVLVSDTADLPTLSSLAYEFKTAPQASLSLSASIVGVDTPRAMLMAYIKSINPFFEYGKEMELTIEAEDYAGNKLEYTWKFKIQQRP